MSVGENLRAIRQAQGLSIREVAKRSGYDSGNLSKLERGRVQWTETTLKMLAPALNCAVRDFFLTEEERKALALFFSLDINERSVILEAFDQDLVTGGNEFARRFPQKLTKTPRAPQPLPRIIEPK